RNKSRSQTSDRAMAVRYPWRGVVRTKNRSGDWQDYCHNPRTSRKLNAVGIDIDDGPFVPPFRKPSNPPNVLDLVKGERPHGKERAQETRRAVPRNLERYLLRREEDPHRTTENGESGAQV